MESERVRASGFCHLTCDVENARGMTSHGDGVEVTGTSTDHCNYLSVLVEAMDCEMVSLKLGGVVVWEISNRQTAICVSWEACGTVSTTCLSCWACWASANAMRSSLCSAVAGSATGSATESLSGMSS
jgi:hypothetical protein